MWPHYRRLQESQEQLKQQGYKEQPISRTEANAVIAHGLLTLFLAMVVVMLIIAAFHH